MINIVFLEILKAICSFRELTEFCDSESFSDYEKLEKFMKTDCLQTALTHNKTNKIKEHVLNLTKKEINECEIDSILPVIRTLTLAPLYGREGLLKRFSNKTKEKQIQFINLLTALNKENDRREFLFKLDF
jgi:hypothetical protein